MDDDDAEKADESRTKRVKKKAKPPPVGTSRGGNKRPPADSSADEADSEDENEGNRREKDRKPNRFLGKGRPRKTSSKDVTTDTTSGYKKHAASGAGSLKERETSKAATQKVRRRAADLVVLHSLTSISVVDRGYSAGALRLFVNLLLCDKISPV